MHIILPEDITKNLQNTKDFLDANIDTAINTVNQNTQQAKTIILENTGQSIKSINQIMENTKLNLNEVAGNTIGDITEKTGQTISGITATASTFKESLQTIVEKIDNLNQTLSEGIQTSINSSLHGLIDNNPQLFWLINHPLQALGILLLGLVLFSGLIGAISNLTEKFWRLILTYPFKLISNVFGLISKSFQKDNEQQKNISIETENQKCIAAVLSRLKANRQEQNLLLQELESLLNT